MSLRPLNLRLLDYFAQTNESGLIRASIETLQRDLLEEAIIVSVVIVIFLFHFGAAVIPILMLPIAVVALSMANC